MRLSMTDTCYVIQKIQQISDWYTLLCAWRRYHRHPLIMATLRTHKKIRRHHLELLWSSLYSDISISNGSTPPKWALPASVMFWLLCTFHPFEWACIPVIFLFLRVLMVSNSFFLFPPMLNLLKRHSIGWLVCDRIRHACDIIRRCLNI